MLLFSGLQKVVALFDMNIEACRILLNTSVKEITAPFHTCVEIGKMDNNLVTRLKTVEAVAFFGEFEFFKVFLIF